MKYKQALVLDGLIYFTKIVDFMIKNNSNVRKQMIEISSKEKMVHPKLKQNIYQNFWIHSGQIQQLTITLITISFFFWFVLLEGWFEVLTLFSIEIPNLLE